MQMTAKTTFSFGDFELNGAKRLLLKKGEPISLNSKTFDLLLALVENHGRILSKDELLEKVWEGQFVEENNLTVQISALRKIFGEKKDEHKFIVTIPGKGYKFIAGENSLAPIHQIVKPSTRNFDDGEAIIGRAAEITEIKNILRDPKKCLLTLTGAGGSGKTKLARTIAAEMQADFADGVFFVELAAVSRAESVAGAIAQMLDVKESGEKSVLDALKDFLRKREILLILDNFEQLLSAANLLKELLDATNLKILVTSRTLLHLKFEQEKVVLPLNIPPRNSNLSAEELSEFSAVELFAVRAQTAKSSFALSAENASVIAEICNKLDGLPLAIELAAARVKLLSPQSILERLENSLKLLTGGAKDLPEHQQTMRGTIRWSYDLLDEAEKLVFRHLSVFVGGFTVEAAEAVLSDDSALDLLVSLIDNNLLVQRDLPDGNARLQMLEVVREFALEVLQTSGEVDDLQRIHAHYFLSLAEEAEPFLSGERGNEWLEKLENDHDNFRAALRWSLEQEPETAARMAATLRQFWNNRSYLTEARSWLEAALEKSDNAPSATRFKLLGAFSLVARNQGDYAATRRASEESLAASRAINDLRQIILSCHAVAGLETREGNFAAARKLFEESLVISRELDDERQIAISFSGLGNLFLAEGKASAARMPIEKSLAISRHLGFRFNISLDLINLGSIAYYEGDAEAAHRHFAESLTIAQDIGNKINVSCCLDGLAGVAAKSENAGQAAKLAGAADSLREALGYEIEITERLFRDDYLAKVRSTLDEKTFAAFYEQGKAMNLSESVALAEQSGLVFNSDEISGEIIIETHSFSRIIIEEEIEVEDETTAFKRFFPKPRPNGQ